MTEMSPIGTTGKLKYATEHLQGEERVQLKLKQGRTPYLVEMKIVDDEHNDLPRDGKTSGHLLVRGPAISSGYYKRDENILDSVKACLPENAQPVEYGEQLFMIRPA